jgi:hypothetical protein
VQGQELAHCNKNKVIFLNVKLKKLEKTYGAGAGAGALD